MRTRKLGRWLLGGALAATGVLAGSQPAAAVDEPGPTGSETVQTTQEPESHQTADPILESDRVWEWG